MEKNITIICPQCRGKTHTQIRKDTLLFHFPLFCPKCKQESIISAKNGKITEFKSRTL
ncbi:MAG: conjugal transfer protein [Firmicutes bacterium]|nr:conjugal transfer protein [Bacillota bacterium]